jgi:prepilin-type processing-associated H-X9-DG protein
MIAKQRTATTGFTLTELLVLLGVGSVLIGVLAADLTQTRTKLLQQACSANMKHWGMAFDMYAQDYNDRLYYDVGGRHFDDSPGIGWQNPYLCYLGGDNSATAIRNLRICPARLGQIDFSTVHSYQMPVGMYKKGARYVSADNGPSVSNVFWDAASNSYFPSLQFLPQPSSFLLLIESNGNTVRCGGLVVTTTQLRNGACCLDPLPAIDRHGGSGVNCLFGDFHAEFVSSQVITNQDAGCSTGNPWFMLIK